MSPAAQAIADLIACELAEQLLEEGADIPAVVTDRSDSREVDECETIGHG